MIQLNNLRLGYYGHKISLPDITGCFKFGSMTAVLGNNGIGKSTLLKTLAGLLPPASGELRFSAGGKPKISYLPQQVNVDRRFPVTVFDVVAMGCWPGTGFLHTITYEQQIIIWESLEYVKLDKLLKQDICVLSVGQFRCMLFARLLVQRAPLVLLDEPFSNIDLETSNLMLSVIGQLHDSGSTIIVVIHDNKMITQYFSDILYLSQTSNFWGHVHGYEKYRSNL